MYAYYIAQHKYISICVVLIASTQPGLTIELSRFIEILVGEYSINIGAHWLLSLPTNAERLKCELRNPAKTTTKCDTHDVWLENLLYISLKYTTQPNAIYPRGLYPGRTKTKDSLFIYMRSS